MSTDAQQLRSSFAAERLLNLAVSFRAREAMLSTILVASATVESSQNSTVAPRLGHIFMPHSVDQNSNQYRGENGLKEQFFSDTVRNALEWKRNNRKSGAKDQPDKK